DAVYNAVPCGDMGQLPTSPFFSPALDSRLAKPDNKPHHPCTRFPPRRSTMATSPEARLKELNLTLPTPGRPMARYKMAVRAGNMLYISGHGPARLTDSTPVTGKCGVDLNVEQGKESARAVGMNILATVRDQVGSLDRVKRLVKTLGMVNSAPDFTNHPMVINGFSELMAEVFGEDAGVGARSAVGMGALPGNIAVEIECIFEVE